MPYDFAEHLFKATSLGMRVIVAPSDVAPVEVSHPACMGLSLSSGITPFLSSFVIPFFCSTRAASILPPRPHISIAVARSGGQGRRFFSAAEGSSLTDASTAAGCRRSGGGRAMIRGEPAIGRD
jgi:hypothetical protein